MLAEANDTGMQIVWGLLLAILLALLIAAVTYLRKWYHQSSDEMPAGGFTLADLRALHRQGKMTDEEFTAAKAKVVEAAQKAAARQAAQQAQSKRSLPPGVEFQQKPPTEDPEADNSGPDETGSTK